MAVMADKAELVEQLEERELTIGQLSGETETIGRPDTRTPIPHPLPDTHTPIPHPLPDTSYLHICGGLCSRIFVPLPPYIINGGHFALSSGEYITLYQSQREALRAKFKEKDGFIQRLITEKGAVQVSGGYAPLINECNYHTTSGKAGGSSETSETAAGRQRGSFKPSPPLLHLSPFLHLSLPTSSLLPIPPTTSPPIHLSPSQPSPYTLLHPLPSSHGFF